MLENEGASEINPKALFGANTFDLLFFAYVHKLAFEDSLLPPYKLLAFLKVCAYGRLPQLLMYLVKQLQEMDTDVDLGPNAGYGYLIQVLVSFMKDAFSPGGSMRKRYGTSIAKSLGFFAEVLLSRLGDKMAGVTAPDISPQLAELAKVDAAIAARLGEAWTGLKGSKTSASAAVAATVASPTTLTRLFRDTLFESPMFGASSWNQYGSFHQLLSTVYSMPGYPTLTSQPVQSRLAIIGEVINAMFDCQSITFLRRDSAKRNNFWKCCIRTRIPRVIRTLFPRSTAEDQALIQTAVSKSILGLEQPTVTLIRLSIGSDELDDMFSSFPGGLDVDIRHELVAACISEGVLPKSAFNAIFKDSGISVDALDYADELSIDGQTLTIDALAEQLQYENLEFIAVPDCLMAKVAAQMEKLSGPKQEEVSRRVLVLLADFVQSGNARPVRYMCQALALNTTAVDVMALCIDPLLILKALVDCIELWREDDEEASYQEAYTDFGAIVVFAITLKQRYHLDLSQLAEVGTLFVGQPSPSSTVPPHELFLSQLLTESDSSQRIFHLSDEQNDQLSGWATALYDAGGISDDLMRSSSVKQFFLVTPAIFQQSMLAHEKGLLPLATFRGGLEYFLQPFLLGSTVGVFKWLSEQLWRHTQKGQDEQMATVISVCSTLILTDNAETEVLSPIHQMVLAICADEMYEALDQAVQAGYTVENRVFEFLEPFVSAINYNLNVQRTGLSSSGFRSQKAIGMSGGGGSGIKEQNWKYGASMIATIKEQVSSLISWSQNQYTGPPFGYELVMILSSIDTLGHKYVLEQLIEEIALAESQGTSHYTVEVVATIATVAFIISISIKSPRPFSDTQMLLKTLNQMVDGYSGKSHDISKQLQTKILQLLTTAGYKQDGSRLDGKPHAVEDYSFILNRTREVEKKNTANDSSQPSDGQFMEGQMFGGDDFSMDFGGDIEMPDLF